MRATCLVHCNVLDVVTLIIFTAEYKLAITKRVYAISFRPCKARTLPHGQLTHQYSNETDTVCGPRVTNHYSVYINTLKGKCRARTGLKARGISELSPRWSSGNYNTEEVTVGIM